MCDGRVEASVKEWRLLRKAAWQTVNELHEFNALANICTCLMLLQRHSLDARRRMRTKSDPSAFTIRSEAVYARSSTH